MAAWLDNVKFNPTAGGTTDWTFSTAVSGYQSPALAGAVNTRVYVYFALDTPTGQWEIGSGAYNTTGPVLPRTTVLYNSSGTGTATGQSGAGTKITFTNVPQVAIIGVKEDLISIEEANSFTAAQKTQARGNISAVGAVKPQKFTASGTYTPSTGMLYCIIECVGGGGAGGGTAGSAGQSDTGGGGGSGGYSRLTATAATIGASQVVTIGAGGTAGTAGNNPGNAGGDTSVGALCIGKGGSGGLGQTGGRAGQGGAGGVAGTGDETFAGNAGMMGLGGNTTSFTIHGGDGAVSHFGGSPQAQIATSNSSFNGVAGTTGSGGSGGCSLNSATNSSGGAGGNGYVRITEFCTTP